MVLIKQVVDRIDPKKIGGIPGIILDEIQKQDDSTELNESEMIWIEKNARTLPFILKNKNLCRILFEIQRDESITRYQLAKRLGLSHPQIHRETKKLKGLELISLDSSIPGFSRGNPCLTNTKLQAILDLLFEMVKRIHGEAFFSDPYNL